MLDGVEADGLGSPSQAHSEWTRDTVSRVSCAQVVDSMGYAGCALTCDIQAIDVGHQDLSGTVCVQDNGDGIIFSGELKGLLPSTSGGFHIHAGTSCDGKEAQGGHYWSGESTCPVAPDPWTGDYDAVWNSDEFGNASPYNVNPGSKLGPPPITGGPFTIGTDESTCGVTGHAVIVHKGCPSDRDDPCDPGVRIGCCVLA